MLVKAFIHNYHGIWCYDLGNIVDLFRLVWKTHLNVSLVKESNLTVLYDNIYINVEPYTKTFNVRSVLCKLRYTLTLFKRIYLKLIKNVTHGDRTIIDWEIINGDLSFILCKCFINLYFIIFIILEINVFLCVEVFYHCHNKLPCI